MQQEMVVVRGSVPISRRTRFLGPLARTEVLGSSGPALAIEIGQMNKREVESTLRDNRVLAVAPSFPMKLVKQQPASGFTATTAGNAWGIEAINAHTSPFGGVGISVAVLDTGIERSHPAFNGMNIVEQDFTGTGNGDSHGHGTHCAGTVCGQDVNGRRIGVARSLGRLMVGKVLDNNGSGSSAQMLQGMTWAAQNGANVISMSLGMDFPGYVNELVNHWGIPVPLATNMALEGYRANVLAFEAISNSIRSAAMFFTPCIIVGAAGNESDRDTNPDWEISVSPPAVSSGFISVAAVARTTSGYKMAGFSNTGAEISAPGVDIESAALGGGLVSWNGTSMATPHIAGCAALWAEMLVSNGSLNSSLLENRLIGNASTNGFVAGFDPTDIGAGMVSAPQ